MATYTYNVSHTSPPGPRVLKFVGAGTGTGSSVVSVTIDGRPFYSGELSWNAPGDVRYVKLGHAIGVVSVTTENTKADGDLIACSGVYTYPETNLPLITQDSSGNAVSQSPIVAPSVVGNTTGFIDLLKHNPYADGVTPSDTAFASAVAEQIATGKPIQLPLFPIVLKNGILFNALVGTPGWSRIKIASGYTNAPTKDYLFGNLHPSQVENAAAADAFSLNGVAFEITPEGGGETVWFKLSNNKRIDIEHCDFLINSAPTSGCSFDFFSANKNVRFIHNTYRNKSDAPAGGMWVRNFGGTTDPNTVCENFVFQNNYFEHQSADEVLAISGYYGMTRNVEVSCNVFYAPAATNKHPYLISFSAGGDAAYPLGQLHNAKFEHNYIREQAATVAVVRVGRDGQNKILRDVVSRDNTIEIDYSGAENIQGVRFLPQLTATSLGELVPVDQGIVSENDTVVGLGATPVIGYYSLWGDVDGSPCVGVVRNSKTRGVVLNGTVRCRVEGGEHTASAGDCHVNPIVVKGGRHRSTSAAGVVYDSGVKAIDLLDGADIGGATYAVSDTSSTTTLPRRWRGCRFRSTHATNTGVCAVNNRNTALVSTITDCGFDGTSQTQIVQGGHGNIVCRSNSFNGAKETDENVVVVTGDVTVNPGTTLVKLTGGTVRTVTLTPSPAVDQVIVIQRGDSNTSAHVVSAGGSNTINGSASFTFSTAWQVLRLRALSSSAWIIV